MLFFDHTPNKHEVIIDGLKVECDYIYCNYRETMCTVEDAEIAKEVHEGHYEPYR